MEKLDFDQANGVLYITYKAGEVSRTVETSPGVYADYAEDGTLLGVEVTNTQAYAMAKKALVDLADALRLPTVV